MSPVQRRLQGRHILLAFGGGCVRARRGGAASGVSGERGPADFSVCLFGFCAKLRGVLFNTMMGIKQLLSAEVFLTGLLVYSFFEALQHPVYNLCCTIVFVPRVTSRLDRTPVLPPDYLELKSGMCLCAVHS